MSLHTDVIVYRCYCTHMLLLLSTFVITASRDPLARIYFQCSRPTSSVVYMPSYPVINTLSMQSFVATISNLNHYCFDTQSNSPF